MNKDQIIRLIPFIALVIGISFIPFFPSFKWFFFLVVPIFVISNILKNLYFVNRNIKHNKIWISPIIDRLLGCIAGIFYIGFASVALLQSANPWIGFLLLLLASSFIYFLETKLKIDEQTLKKSNHEYKVISEKLERQLKIVAIIVTIISIIAMIISLYLKWWIVFGIDVGLLLLVAIGLIIYDKYFTTKL